MKILVISGSRRERSYSRVLAGLAYEHCREKYGDVELLDLAVAPLENFRGFEAEYRPDTYGVVNHVYDADVLIVCSPIYDGLLASAVKNLFEFADYKALEGKVAGFALMSEGTISYLQVQGQLNALMNYFRVLSNPRAAYVSQADFDPEMNLVSPAKINRLKRVVDETVSLAQGRGSGTR